MKHLCAALSIFVLIIPLGYARAHTLGASLEATSTPYFIDVGYDPDPMETGSSVRFEFELRNSTHALITDYDYVWVRVVRDRQTHFASGIHRQFLGPTTLLYTFDQPGAYILDVGFRAEEGDEIAHAEFTFDVANPQEKHNIKFIVWGPALLAALIGVFAVLYLRAGRRTSDSLPA